MSELSSLIIMEKDRFLAHLSASRIINFPIKYIPFMKESNKLRTVYTVESDQCDPHSWDACEADGQT